MSDTIYKFIPADPYAAATLDQMAYLAALRFDGAACETQCHDQIQFADAGENFYSVACPLCRSDLTAWWSGAMDRAWSPHSSGFANLSVVTPCCGRTASLHDLDYNWPQGFYRTMLCLRAGVAAVDHAAVRRTLEQETGMRWRVVIARV